LRLTSLLAVLFVFLALISTGAQPKEMNMPFSRARIEGANSDSSSFIEKKIPAVTIHGMSNKWPEFLHTGNDQASQVNAMSVYLG
jgi:Iap family predicted aminopeptidase